MSEISMSSPKLEGARDAWRMKNGKKRKPRVPTVILIALAILLCVAIVGVFAQLIAPYGYDEQDLSNRLKPPAFLGGPIDHLLGTDDLGRDLLSRLIYSIQISLATALLGTAVAAFIGTTIGFIAARFGGIVDEMLMLLVDAQASIPFLLLALATLAILGNSFLLFAILLGLNGWEVYARVARSLVLTTKVRPYVESLELLGATSTRVYLRHILPNIAGVLIVKMTLNFPGTILLESGLSFLGLGIQPPLTSLGLMIGAGREFLLFSPWACVVPGTIIFITTLSISLVGDWLRDRIDPKIANT